MANKKFSEFELKTTTSDVSHVVGYNGAENVQITPANFVTTGGTGVFLPLAGGTMTGTNGVVFPDNFYLNLGTSSDFEIYHDGNNSYLKDQGTGELILASNGTGIKLEKTSGEKMIHALTDGAVELYFDSVKKFETTSTGISVTGTVTADSYYLGSSNSISLATTGAGNIFLRPNGQTTSGQTHFNSSGDVTLSGNITIGSQKFLKFGGNGARIYGDNANNFLTFDTNSTERMRLDASGNLGLGTSTPSAKLDVQGGTLRVTHNSSYNLELSDTGGNGSINANGDSASLKFGATVALGSTARELMHLDGITGNVGIGTSTPDAKLSIARSSNAINTEISFKEGAQRTAVIGMEGATTNDMLLSTLGGIRFFTASDVAVGSLPSNERMRLDSSGNLGLGTSTPTKKLTVNAGSTSGGGINVTGSSSPAIYIDETSGPVNSSFQNDGAGSYLGTSTSHPMIFKTANTERMRLDSSGNLGVGTSTPNVGRLEVGGASPTLAINSLGNTEPTLFLLRNGGANGIGLLKVKDGGDMSFQTGANGAAQSEKMRLTSGGAIQFNNYGSGTFTGTLAKTLGVTSAGDVIEFDVASGLTGVTNSSSDSPNSKTALGVNAGGSSETGVFNTSIGNSAGSGLTSGGANVAIGYQAGQGITTTNTSVAIGYLAKSGNNTEDTVAVGAESMRYGTTALGVAIGYKAMQGTSFPNDNYSNSVAIGAHTLLNSSGSSGSQNTAVGHFAGSINTTGSNNTYLGAQVTGATSGSNNVVLGANATPSSGTVSNEITLGDSSVTVIRAAVTSITALSDERDKKDIVPLSYGLDFINSLEPKEFVWDNRVEKRIETTSTKGEDFKSITTETEVEFYSANKGKKDFGFIAQEVKLLDDDTLRLVYDTNPKRLEMSYGKLVPILVKAIQELKTQLDNIK